LLECARCGRKVNEEPYFIDRQLEMPNSVSNDSKMTTASNYTALKPERASSSYLCHNDNDKMTSDDSRRKPDQPSHKDDNVMTTTSNDSASKPARLSSSHLLHNDDEMTMSDNSRTKPDQPSRKDDNVMTTTSNDSASKPAQLSSSHLRHDDDMTMSENSRRKPDQSLCKKTSSSTPRHNVAAVSNDAAVSSSVQKTTVVNNTDRVVDECGDGKDKHQNNVQSMNIKPPIITVTAEIHAEPGQLQSVGQKSPLPSKDQFKVCSYWQHLS